MADGRKSRIVRLRRHLQHMAANSRPDRPGLGQQGCRGARVWREDHLALLVQVGLGVLYTRGLAAGHRVRGHKAAKVFSQSPLRCGNHVLLGGADIHHQHTAMHSGPDRAQAAFGGGHRYRQQHQIAAGGSAQGVVRSAIDHAELERPGHCAGGFAVANHPVYQACLPERQGKGATHQATANQAELLQHHSPAG